MADERTTANLRVLPRPLLLAGFVVFCVVLASLGFALGRATTTERIASDVSDSGAIPVFAEAEMRAVSSSRAIEGVAQDGTQIAVPSFVPEGRDRAVVTATPLTVGDPVSSGTRIVDISGRPVIALALPTPLARSLRPGDTGTDVAGLQAALGELGLYRGATDGEFGSLLSQAVEALFESADSSPPTPSADRASALADARTALAAARASEASAADIGAAQRVVNEATVGAGPWMSIHEVLAISSTQLRLASVASLGTVLGEEVPVAALTAGAPVVAARASVVDVEAFPVGTAVTVSLIGAGAEGDLPGEVVAVGDFTDGTPVDEEAAPTIPGHDVQVQLSSDQADAVPSGSHVLVTAAAADELTLAVPLISLRQDDRGSFVLVRASEASEPERVSVVAGDQANGWVAVEGEGLEEGVEVQVGP